MIEATVGAKMEEVICQRLSSTLFYLLLVYIVPTLHVNTLWWSPG